jgi:hypothetical protein
LRFNTPSSVATISRVPGAGVPSTLQNFHGRRSIIDLGEEGRGRSSSLGKPLVDGAHRLGVRLVELRSVGARSAL